MGLVRLFHRFVIGTINIIHPKQNATRTKIVPEGRTFAGSMGNVDESGGGTEKKEKGANTIPIAKST